MGEMRNSHQAKRYPSSVSAPIYPIKEDPLGIVQEVQPEGSYFWDGPRIAHYHNKLKVAREVICIKLLLLICCWVEDEWLVEVAILAYPCDVDAVLALSAIEV